MTTFTCPMHPEIQEKRAGTCPKCGMKLVLQATGLKKLAFSATLHCFTGCSVGEILGMVLGIIFKWPNIETVVVATVLAFLFGYSLTMLPLLRSGMSFGKALLLAFGSDTASIASMELADNVVIFFIPGAMDAQITSSLFWGSLALSLMIAFIAAFPVNMYLIAKGRGHRINH